MQFIGTDFLVKKQNSKRPQVFTVLQIKNISAIESGACVEEISNRQAASFCCEAAS